MSLGLHDPRRAEAGQRREAVLPRTARAFVLDPARRTAVCLGIGLASLAWAVFVGGWREAAISYLPAWLCLLALPTGALPVAIMIERADAWRPQPETALLETLRWLLGLMPAAAILVLPILAALPDLYPWAAGAPARTPLAAIWFTAPFLLVRVAVALLVWIGLAMLFARRGGEPFGKAGRIDDGRAVLGLGLHMVVGTILAADLVTAVSAEFRSSLSGLLLIAGWSSLALSAAILAAPPDIGPSRRRLDRLTPLAVLLAIWAAMHLSQYLILGSADGEIWYGARAGREGRALAFLAGAVVGLAAMATWRPGEYRTRLVATLAVAVQVMGMFWYVTPSLRGAFTLTLVDALALVGVAAIAVGLMPLTARFFPSPDAPAAGVRL